MIKYWEVDQEEDIKKRLKDDMEMSTIENLTMEEWYKMMERFIKTKTWLQPWC